MRATNPVTLRRIDRMLRMSPPVSIRRIATACQVSSKTVQRRRKALGITETAPIGRKQIADDVAERVSRLLKEGYNNHAVARKTGVTWQAVNTIRLRLGLPPARRSRLKAVQEQQATHRSQVIERHYRGRYIAACPDDIAPIDPGPPDPDAWEPVPPDHWTRYYTPYFGQQWQQGIVRRKKEVM